MKGAEESIGKASDELAVAGAEPKVGASVSPSPMNVVRSAVLDVCG